VGDAIPPIVYYPSYFRWCDQATFRLFLAAAYARRDARRAVEGGHAAGRRRMLRSASQTGEKPVVESHISQFGRIFTISRLPQRCGRDRGPGQRDPYLGQEGRRRALAEGGADSR
jgi:hypothetical protein